MTQLIGLTVQIFYFIEESHRWIVTLKTNNDNNNNNSIYLLPNRSYDSITDNINNRKKNKTNH